MDIQPFTLPILPEGQTAHIHRRPSHGQVKAIMRAYRRDQDDNEQDVFSDVLLIMVEKWSVVDERGKPIPLSKEGIDAAPFDAVNAILGEIAPLLANAFPNL